MSAVQPTTRDVDADFYHQYLPVFCLVQWRVHVDITDVLARK